MASSPIEIDNYQLLALPAVYVTMHLPRTLHMRWLIEADILGKAAINPLSLVKPLKCAIALICQDDTNGG